MKFRGPALLFALGMAMVGSGLGCEDSPEETTAAPSGASEDASAPPPSEAPPPPPAEDAGATTKPDPRAAEMHRRADAALATMMLRYWPQLRDADNNAYWTYANDWDVVLDSVERYGGARYAGAARMFYDVQDARGWARDYYDDENWMALTLLRAYDLFKEPAYLSRATQLFADIRSAWDETCCLSGKPGGIWWRHQKDSKVTAINGGAVITGVRLYERTKDPAFLSFAQKVYAFWKANMVDPVTGHVYDHFTSAGAINKEWTFTYNEGVMIGGAVELARVTGDAAYLADAHRYAAFMLAKESAMTPAGTVLSDGKCGKAGGDDGEQFKGIAARYLALLYEADRSHTEYREFLVRSSNAIWDAARDPASGLVSCDWVGPYDPSTNSVNSLSSAAMTLAVTARILGPAAPASPLEMEAEEGALHGGIGLENTHAGFSGTGYVAGWQGEGTWVDLITTLPSGGTFDAEIRYASELDAKRLLHVNGTTVVASLSLPKTGGYGTYGTVRTPVTLAAGKNTISLVWNGSQGSVSYVNLDKVTLIAK